jgi:hypothetical protein
MNPALPGWNDFMTRLRVNADDIFIRLDEARKHDPFALLDPRKTAFPRSLGFVTQASAVRELQNASHVGLAR